MAEIIDMPKLSDTMMFGTLVCWMKKEGDLVKSGDILAEVETDKATMEVENFIDGVLLKQYVSDGEKIPVGGPMCVIGKAGEKINKIKIEKEDNNVLLQKKSQQSFLKEEEKLQQNIENSQNQIFEIANPKLTSINTSIVSNLEVKNIKASPLAKKIAKKENISLSQLKGTGPNGRILKVDVLKALNIENNKSNFKSTQSLKFSIGPTKLVQISSMRAAIANKLIQSKNESPHFYLEAEINAQSLIETRKALNEEYSTFTVEKENDVKFTINDLIMVAAVKALKKAPTINARWKKDAIQYCGEVHLAFGVALKEGLITPVIRNANSKDLTTISKEAKSLIKRAHLKELKFEEISNSTFTITNLGMYGINNFYGIINPPNAAILSIGAAIKKPIIDSNNKIVPGICMSIGISCDHRVVDGAIAATYMAAIKKILENPSLLLI